MAKKRSKKDKDKALEEKFIAGQEQLDLYFDKYAILYKSDDPKVVEHQDRINRQRYIYERIHEKGLENTNIEKLLDMTIEDVQLQFNVKQSIEYKVGFIIALWGVLVVTLLQINVPIQLFNKMRNKVFVEGALFVIPLPIRIFSGITLILLIIFSVVSIVYICKSLLTNKYANPSFNNREMNYKSAVDDKNIAIVRLLEIYTNIWEKNEVCNLKKAKDLDRLIKVMIGFIDFIILCYIINSL